MPRQSGERYRSEPQDFIDRVIELERRLSVLERSPRIGNTAIDQGALRVKDASGDVRVEIGLLSDGTYGIAVKEEGQDSFHQVPFVYTDTVSIQESTFSTSYTNLETFGPSVEVPVRSTGRLLVLMTTQIQWPANAFAASMQSQGAASVEMSGANTMAASLADDTLLSFHVVAITIGGGGTVSETGGSTATTTGTFEGLNPGLTTVTMKYLSSLANQIDFGRRTLTCIPL